MTRSRTYLLIALAVLAVAVLAVPPAVAASPRSVATDLILAGHGASGQLVSTPEGARLLAPCAAAALAHVPPARAAFAAGSARTSDTRPRSSHAPFLDRLRI